MLRWLWPSVGPVRGAECPALVYDASRISVSRPRHVWDCLGLSLLLWGTHALQHCGHVIRCGMLSNSSDSPSGWNDHGRLTLLRGHGATDAPGGYDYARRNASCVT